MTLDERIIGRLKDGPQRCSDLATYCAVSVDDASRALGRLKYAGRAMCNIGRPYWNWHAANGCPCGECASRGGAP